MKRILLTTTSLVMAAGVAQADISWSGKATAGIARTGEVKAVASQLTASMIADLAAEYAKVRNSAEGTVTVKEITAVAMDAAAPATATTEALLVSQIAGAKNALALDTAADTSHKTLNDEMTAEFDAILAVITAANSTAVAAAATGDWDTYSEINATATASVAMDNGMTLSVGASVDAGIGYDFADDDGFDAAKTNGVGLDSISLDMGTMGKLTLDEDNMAHLVDGDDDASADVSYTNTFGAATFNLVADMDKDGDAAAVKAVAAVVTDADATSNAVFTDTTETTTISTAAVTGVAADVAWSAKISMPLAGGTGYIAMDEEGGNAFGATATLSGVGISFDSKLEALEEELSIDRSNTIGLTYAVGATTFGATWNSVEDGDQWGISAAYAADGLSISASTDEGSDWSVSGSMDLGGGASVVAGTNYTEDAYVGVSFAF